MYGRKMYDLKGPLYSGTFANHTSPREILFTESSVSGPSANGPLVSRLDRSDNLRSKLTDGGPSDGRRALLRVSQAYPRRRYSW